MKYMSFIPNISSYQFPDGTYRRVKDIFKRPSVKLSTDVALSADQYTVIDGTRPDSLSKQFYKDYHFFWSLFLTNNIIDIYKDWPVSYTSWLTELEKTNPEFVIYTRFRADIKSGDIVCKYDPSTQKFDGRNYGIVSNYDSFNRKIEFLSGGGQLKVGDVVVILRETANGFEKIIMPDGFVYQTILKTESKIDSVSFFAEKSSQGQGDIELSPYDQGGSVADDEIEDLENAPDTILWKYINNTLPNNIKAVPFREEKENEWLFKKNIVVVPKNKITDVIKSVIDSINNQRVS